MFEIPEKVIERGNLILIYSDYVLKIYRNTDGRMKAGFKRGVMFQNEIDFLKNCKSKFIIDLLYADNENRFIILKKADCNLKEALKTKVILIDTALEFVFKLKKEFKKKEIIHRDLTPKNIVYFIKSQTLKVIDFEIASYNDDFKKIYTKHITQKDNFKYLRSEILKSFKS